MRFGLSSLLRCLCDTGYCADPSGGHLNPCNTLYGAFGLSIVVWILFALSLAFASVAIKRERRVAEVGSRRMGNVRLIDSTICQVIRSGGRNATGFR